MVWAVTAAVEIAVEAGDISLWVNTVSRNSKLPGVFSPTLLGFPLDCGMAPLNRGLELCQGSPRGSGGLPDLPCSEVFRDLPELLVLCRMAGALSGVLPYNLFACLAFTW